MIITTNTAMNTTTTISPSVVTTGFLEPNPTNYTWYSPPVSTTENPCIYVEYIDAFIIVYMIMPAIVVILLLSFLKRRKSKLRNICWGRPHLIYPVNFIDEYGHRWVYACVFILITYKVLLLFEGSYFWKPVQFNDPVWMKTYGWCKVFVAMLNTAMLVIVYYPFLACISLRRMILANLLGLAYLGPWLWYFIEVWKACPGWENLENGGYSSISRLIPDIPVVIAFLTLISSYFFDLIFNIYIVYLKHKQSDKYKERLVNKHMKDPQPVLYTKQLMMRLEKVPPSSVKEKIIYHASYNMIAGFQYSPRVVCTMAIAALGLIKLALQVTTFVNLMYDLLIYYYDAAAPAIELVGTNYTDQYEFYREYIVIARVSGLFGVWMSFLLHVLFMVHMVITYRQHLKLYFKGDKSWHFENNSSPVSQMVASLRYSGYQIAYIIYGFLIMAFLLTVVAFAFAVLIALPIKYRYYNFFIRFLITYWPSIIVTLFIYFSQIIFAKLFLLQGWGNYMALDNRRFYHIASFFFFFYNILLGLFACLKRILFSVIFGTLLISRLDRCLLMRGFEQFDSGFKAYLGMLEVEVNHNHPVMKAFVHVLTSTIENRSSPSHIYDNTNMIQDKYNSLENGVHTSVGMKEIPVKQTKNKRWINKWFKAVTLINNPSLHLDLLKDEVKTRKDKHTIRDFVIDTAGTVVSGAIVGGAIGTSNNT